MQTEEQRAEFFGAYKALKEIRERHEAEMLAIVRGEKTVDQDQLDEQVAHLISAHRRFVDAGAPFVGYGPKLA